MKTSHPFCIKKLKGFGGLTGLRQSIGVGLKDPETSIIRMSVQDSIQDSTDNDSTSSRVSMAKIPLECPSCKKEIQARGMFNHIIKFHPDYFKASMKVWDENRLEELIDNKFALPIEWEFQNDFDETEFKNIWGCLACNSTFTVEHKGNYHCSQAKCKAKHISELKKLIKEEKKEKEKKLKTLNTSRSKWENRTAQAIYNDCFNTIVVIKNKIFNEYLPFMEKLNSKYNLISIPEFPLIPSITENSDKTYQLKQERCVDKYLSEIENIVKHHNKNLPVQYVSDEKYNTLDRYSSLGSYIKYSANDNKCNAEWYSKDANWGYTTTVL